MIVQAVSFYFAADTGCSVVAPSSASDDSRKDASRR